MLLVTSATRFEMDAFVSCCPSTTGWSSVLTGIGPVEAAVQVTAHLAQTADPVHAVLNFGVGGAYIRPSGGANILDLCLADCEILGDLGICCGDEIEPLRGEALEVLDTFPLACPEIEQTVNLLADLDIPFHRGSFVTVNCVSASRRRGEHITRQHQAICENMEGAAVARVCRHFHLPLIELRCISNLVEDRNTQHWRLREACQRCGQVVAQVVEGLTHG